MAIINSDPDGVDADTAARDCWAAYHPLHDLSVWVGCFRQDLARNLTTGLVYEGVAEPEEAAKIALGIARHLDSEELENSLRDAATRVRAFAGALRADYIEAIHRARQERKGRDTGLRVD